MDLVWVDSLNEMIVNHPPDLWTGLTFSKHLKQIHQNFLWLDIKNLDKWNEANVLDYLNELNDKYKFKNRIIIESTNSLSLNCFTNAGYYTSYYIDNFNCYAASKDSIVTKAALIAHQLTKTKVCALSSDFTNVIFIEKYFNQYPILTWYLPNALDWAEMLREKNLTRRNQIKVLLVK